MADFAVVVLGRILISELGKYNRPLIKSEFGSRIRKFFEVVVVVELFCSARPIKLESELLVLEYLEFKLFTELPILFE